MPVMGNAFMQISPCYGGQLWNDISFSLLKPHTVHFNGGTFPCQWEYTPDDDGQWRTITSAFSRHRRIPTTSCPWPVEQYVRVSRDLWILNFQPRGAQEVWRWNATGKRQGTYYNTPIKILRLNAGIREPTSWWQELAIYDGHIGNLFNPDY